MFLLVGLGNPGEKYEGTRHNLGFEILDEFARKLGVHGSWFIDKKFKSQLIKVNEPRTNNYQLLLVKPQTYMNLSGMAVLAVAKYYKIKPKDITVIHDELDLLLGHIKIRLGGSDAGHHGIESIIKKLGTEQFVRLRLGIGANKTLSGEHKKVAFSAEHFVMEPFLPQEHNQVKSLIKKAVKALEVLLEKGIDKAQAQYN